MQELHAVFGPDVREERATRTVFETLQSAVLWVDDGTQSDDEQLNLYQILMRPILKHPDDLQQQVQVILNRWRAHYRSFDRWSPAQFRHFD